MEDREKIITQVDANMHFEGMLLTALNKERLCTCYGKSQSGYKEVRQKLVKKYTVNASGK